MRVLQINQVYKFGSTGRIVYDLQLTAEENGIEMFAAYGYPTLVNDVGNEGTRVLCLQPSTLRRKLNILKTRLFDHHGFYNRHETQLLLDWIEEVNPDLIHLHNIHCHYLNVEMLFEYIKNKEIPIIWTLHDCWSFTGHCAYFDISQCNKWKTGCHHCPSTKDYPETWFFDRSKETYNDKKRIFLGVNRLVLCPPSQWLGNLAKESFLKDYKVHVINNGIDTEAFCPIISDLKQRLGIEGKKVLLSVLSGFNIRKGADLLCQIPQMLNENEVLIWVGISEKDIPKAFDSRLIPISHTNSVKELAELYSVADCFINTTLEENFPTVNLEALACGTPVVTFETGGSIESVLDGEEDIKVEGTIRYSSVGAVVPKRDLNALLTAARRIMYSNLSYKDVCRKKAVSLYNKRVQYLKYIELYRSILTK